MFGQSTQIVFQTGYRLNLYTFDIENNIFVLQNESIKSPKRTGLICFNGNSNDANINKYL